MSLKEYIIIDKRLGKWQSCNNVARPSQETCQNKQLHQLICGTRGEANVADLKPRLMLKKKAWKNDHLKKKN